MDNINQIYKERDSAVVVMNKVKLENTNLEIKSKQLEEHIESLQSSLAISVSKECKCKMNTGVNHDIVNRNLELKKLLKEAAVFIEVADKDFRIELGSRIKPFEGKTTYRDFLNKDLIKELVESNTINKKE